MILDTGIHQLFPNMFYSVTPTESSYTQVGPLSLLEILHNPADVSAYSRLLGHLANFKERLVLSVGISLLSIEPQCEGSPLVNCDMITL